MALSSVLTILFWYTIINMIDVIDVFANRLKDLRTDKGLSLNQLAKDLGIVESSLSRWERKLRAPNIESLVLLAQYFEVSTDYLLGLED